MSVFFDLSISFVSIPIRSFASDQYWQLQGRGGFAEFPITEHHLKTFWSNFSSPSSHCAPDLSSRNSSSSPFHVEFHINIGFEFSDDNGDAHHRQLGCMDYTPDISHGVLVELAEHKKELEETNSVHDTLSIRIKLWML